MELEFDLEKKDEGTVEAAEESANTDEGQQEEAEAPIQEKAAPKEAGDEAPAKVAPVQPAPEGEAEEASTEAVVEVPSEKGVDISAAKEEVAGGPLMVAAYLAIWLVVFYFIFRVRNQTEKLSARVEEMEQKLDRGLEKASGASGSE